MKRFVLFLAAGLMSLFILSPAAALAVDPLAPSCATAPNTEFCGNKTEESKRTFINSKNSLLFRIAQMVVYITAAVSVIMIIIGGFRYVISNGDSNGMQGAKNTILYAIIGLAVAAMAQLIVTFVLTRFL